VTLSVAGTADYVALERIINDRLEPMVDGASDKGVAYTVAIGLLAPISGFCGDIEDFAPIIDSLNAIACRCLMLVDEPTQKKLKGIAVDHYDELRGHILWRFFVHDLKDKDFCEGISGWLDRDFDSWEINVDEYVEALGVLETPVVRSLKNSKAILAAKAFTLPSQGCLRHLAEWTKPLKRYAKARRKTVGTKRGASVSGWRC